MSYVVRSSCLGPMAWFARLWSDLPLRVRLCVGLHLRFASFRRSGSVPILASGLGSPGSMPLSTSPNFAFRSVGRLLSHGLGDYISAVRFRLRSWSSSAVLFRVVLCLRLRRQFPVVCYSLSLCPRLRLPRLCPSKSRSTFPNLYVPGLDSVLFIEQTPTSSNRVFISAPGAKSPEMGNSLMRRVLTRGRRRFNVRREARSAVGLEKRHLEEIVRCIHLFRKNNHDKISTTINRINPLTRQTALIVILIISVLTAVRVSHASAFHETDPLNGDIESR